MRSSIGVKKIYSEAIEPDFPVNDSWSPVDSPIGSGAEVIMSVCQ